MASKPRVIALVLASLIVAVGLFFLLRDEGRQAPGTTMTSSTTVGKTDVKAMEIRMKGGSPIGGPKTLKFVGDERIRFIVVPDATVEEVHVHGYEIAKMTQGGEPVVFSFPADLEGSFEVEAHLVSGRDSPIATLEVRPN